MIVTSSLYQQVNKSKVILTEAPAVTTELGHSYFTGGKGTRAHLFGK